MRFTLALLAFAATVLSAPQPDDGELKGLSGLTIFVISPFQLHADSEASVW